MTSGFHSALTYRDTVSKWEHMKWTSTRGSERGLAEVDMWKWRRGEKMPEFCGRLLRMAPKVSGLEPPRQLPLSRRQSLSASDCTRDFHVCCAFNNGAAEKIYLLRAVNYHRAATRPCVAPVTGRPYTAYLGPCLAWPSANGVTCKQCARVVR